MRQLHRAREQRRAYRLPTPRGDDVKLFQPGHQASVLERPGIRQRRQTHGLIAILGEKQSAALGHFDQARHSRFEALGRERNGVLFELRLQQANGRAALIGIDQLDSQHGAHHYVRAKAWFRSTVPSRATKTRSRPAKASFLAQVLSIKATSSRKAYRALILRPAAA